jgi:hypothetical protein
LVLFTVLFVIVNREQGFAALLVLIPSTQSVMMLPDMCVSVQPTGMIPMQLGVPARPKCSMVLFRIRELVHFVSLIPDCAKLSFVRLVLFPSSFNPSMVISVLPSVVSSLVITPLIVVPSSDAANLCPLSSCSSSILVAPRRFRRGRILRFGPPLRVP